MQVARSLFVLMFAAIAATTGFTAQADDAPVLAVLEHSGGLLPKRADIRSKTGLVKSPFANMPRAVWVLREGDTLSQEHSPPARFIRLFQQSGNSPQMLCSLVVRYARTEKGWRPAYLLLQLPSNIWDGEKFMPRPGMGTREPVQIVNATGPTLDGYYHGLSFGLASGPIQITAWEVQ